MFWAQYHLVTGRIRGYFSGQEPTQDEAIAGYGFVESPDRGTDRYVDVSGPTIMAKTELSLTPDKSNIAADGVDAATIAVPAGVTVSLNGGEPVEVTDGEVVFKTLDAGDHVLTFSGIRYLSQEIQIGAV